MKLIKLVFCIALASVASLAQSNTIGDLLSLSYARATLDDDAVAKYIEPSLEALPESPIILNAAMMQALYESDLETAIFFQNKIKEQGINDPFGALVAWVHAARSQNWEGLTGLSNEVGFLDDIISEAWSIAGGGDVDSAVSYLDQAIAQGGSLSALYKYQQAMMIAYYNQNYARSLELLKDEDGAYLYLGEQSYVAIMVMALLENDPTALEQITENLGPRAFWPAEYLEPFEFAMEGKIHPSVIFAKPQNALAEYLDLVLSQSDGNQFPRTTMRMFALLLSNLAPEVPRYQLGLLGHFYQNGEFEDVLQFVQNSEEVLNSSHLKNIYNFNSLLQLGREEEARAVLESEDKSFQNLKWIADSFQILEEHENAIEAYKETLNFEGLDGTRRAEVLYRGSISAQIIQDWELSLSWLAEALELAPDDPDILNNYGYTLVDLGQDLDLGLELVGRAVEISDSEPHILDSLGWAYFKIGEYEKALEPIERAVVFMSTNVIVNAHLGDVYWKLGRQREATYQWKRALENLEEDLPDITRAELEDRLANGLE